MSSSHNITSYINNSSVYNKNRQNELTIESDGELESLFLLNIDNKSCMNYMIVTRELHK